MVVGDLVAVMRLNNAQFRKGMRESQNALGSLDKAAARTKAVLGGLFAGASVAGFAAFAQKTIDAADGIGKLAVRLKASTEELSELQFVAERSGVGVNTLNMGLQRMQRRLGEAAATGKGEAAPALDRLGLSADRLAKLPLSEQFETIADALSGVENAGERTALAMRFFDSEGVALLQTMEGGAKGIRELRGEARALGATITQDMADKAAIANDRMTDLQTRLNGVGRELVFNVAEPFSRFLGYLGRAVSPVTEGVAAAFDGLFAVMNKGLQFWLRGLQKVVEGVRFFADKLGMETGRLDEAIAGLGGAAEGAGKRAKENWEAAAIQVERFSTAFHDALRSGAPASGRAPGGGIAPPQIQPVVEYTTKTVDEVKAGPLKDLEDSIANSIVAGARGGSKGMVDAFRGALEQMGAEFLRSGVLELVRRLPMFGGGPIGGLFAGFFANGGSIPAGQFGVVGERGPELVQGPATVTPMGQQSGERVVLVMNNNFEAGVTPGQVVAVMEGYGQKIRADVLNALSRPRFA